MCDELLNKPRDPQCQTKSGLYQPASVQEGEKVESGYVVNAGPGFPNHAVTEEEEVWKKREHEQVHYLPLQAKEGDLAIFLQNAAYEISFDDEKYLIVPHSAVIMLILDDALFE